MRGFDPYLIDSIVQRKQAVESLKAWVPLKAWTHYVTLNFNWRTGRVSDPHAQTSFYNFMDRLDRELYGQNRETLGVDAMAFPEHLWSNRHYHVLMRIESAKMEDERRARERIASLWGGVVRGGTVNVQMVVDRGAADYCMKDLWKPGHYERVLFSAIPLDPDEVPSKKRGAR